MLYIPFRLFPFRHICIRRPGGGFLSMHGPFRPHFFDFASHLHQRAGLAWWVSLLLKA